MSSRIWLCSAATTAALMGLLTATDASASKALIAGTYFNTSTYTSVTGCPDGVFPVGQPIASYFENPGPGRSGAVVRVVASSTDGASVTVLKYDPPMPAAGQTVWSGSGVDTIQPGGATYNYTFKSTFTYVDSRSYLVKQTMHWPSTNFPNCTTKSTQAGVYTGQ